MSQAPADISLMAYRLAQHFGISVGEAGEAFKAILCRPDLVPPSGVLVGYNEDPVEVTCERCIELMGTLRPLPVGATWVSTKQGLRPKPL